MDTEELRERVDRAKRLGRKYISLTITEFEPFLIEIEEVDKILEEMNQQIPKPQGEQT